MPASHPMRTPAPAFELRTQKAALITAAFFFAIGLLGFVPGVTTDRHQLTFTGEHSYTVLLGVLTVSVPQNLVHLAFAFAGVILARTFGRARGFLIGGGVAYSATVIVAYLVNPGGSTELTIRSPMPNVAIGVAMIAVGVAVSRGRHDDGWHFGAGQGSRPH